VLVLRARKRGRLALVVEENGHRARSVVVVTGVPGRK
jgi:hypothetical protein